MKEAIRLTNKTAIALRKSAKKVRTAYFAAAVILSVMLGAAGIVLGFFWLPAVPVMITVITLMDCALMTASRSRYLSLLGQAICTEAAAREISADRKAQSRHDQAVKDLMEMKEDLKKPSGDMSGKKPGTQPFFEKKNEEEQEDENLLPEAATTEAQPMQEAPRRRRRQNPLTIIRSEQAK